MDGTYVLAGYKFLYVFSSSSKIFFVGSNPIASVDSNPFRTKFVVVFSYFTPFYEVKCEKLFCKTNFKLKV